MKLTTYYRLKKPEGTDVVNVDDFNDNFDAIDGALNDAANAAGDLSNGKVFTTAAGTRANIASGETLAQMFSKIMKWFTDFGSGAFSNVANNDNTTAEGYVADARIVKTHGDEIDQIRTSFQDGCSTIANAVTGGRDGQGTGGVPTATNASPATIAANIQTMGQTNYNAGVTATQKGDASTGDVLAGKKFTSATAGVDKTGTLTDYRSNVQTVTPSGGTGDETLNLNVGVHNKVKVNRNAPYQAGVTATQKGNASTADVVSGKTFTSATAGVNKTGALADYRGASNCKTVTTTAGNGVETLTLDAGVHDRVKVDRSNAYTAGADSVKGGQQAVFTAQKSSSTSGDTSAKLQVKVNTAGYCVKDRVVDAATCGTASVSTTAGTGTETRNITPGAYARVTVDRTAAYNAGVASVKVAKKLTLTASQTGNNVDIADDWYTTCDASAVYNKGVTDGKHSFFRVYGKCGVKTYGTYPNNYTGTYVELYAQYVNSNNELQTVQINDNDGWGSTLGTTVSFDKTVNGYRVYGSTRTYHTSYDTSETTVNVTLPDGTAKTIINGASGGLECYCFDWMWTGDRAHGGYAYHWGATP